MTKSEQSVADFYASVMTGRPPEVQRLVVRLLSREFKQASDLEDEILAAAKLAEEEGNEG